MSFDNFLDNVEAKSLQEKKLEKLMQRKQELAQRQSQQYLEDLFKENSFKPVKIQSIQVNNSMDFRPNFLNKQFLPLYKDNLTLGEFFRATEEVTKNLTRVNILENLVIQLQDMPSSGGLYFRRNPDLMTLIPTFNLFPVKKFYAKTGSNIGNGEGDGYIQFQFRNIFGGGENVSFDATTGTRTSSSYLLNYNMPVNNNTKYIWDTSAYVNTRSLEWIGSETKNLGFSSKVMTKLSLGINHELGVDGIWRILDNKTSKSSVIMDQAGHNIKNSFNYNILYDTRDNIHLPSKGYFARFGLEVSGLTPFSTNNFIKSVVEAQATRKITESHSLILTNKFGMINSSENSFILDRFFMGGPNDVRSFLLNGLGPKSYGNCLGGDLFFNGGVSLISKVPYTAKDSNFKLHNFFNFGSLQLYDHSNGLDQNINKLFGLFSTSYGFGILYNHPMARFELNFVLPLSTHQRDSTRKGLQYGIGVSFL